MADLVAPPSTAPAPDRDRHRRRAMETVWTLVGTLALWILIRLFLVEAFRIPSASMEDTLLPGDVLLVAKPVFGVPLPGGHRLPALRDPRRGEIVIFVSPEDGRTMIVKRLLALPGDTVGMEGGVLVRNGQPIAEPYVKAGPLTPEADSAAAARLRRWSRRHLVTPPTGDYQPTAETWGPIVVPAGGALMLGDNRGDSYDSRFWGLLPLENLRGTPLITYYSFEPGNPLAVRPNRLFRRPR